MGISKFVLFLFSQVNNMFDSLLPFYTNKVTSIHDAEAKISALF